LRFLADGPSLPDELLVASDEGRVLFFSGAGVSRAKAGLPDFLGLAKSVLRELRVLPESPAQKLVDTAQRLDPIAGVGGILAADRIFALLERDFSVIDIERAVGAALKPKNNVDLSAHRTLLALSRDAAGKVQLVTTNFDLLFEAAAPRVPVWAPNRLPDLRGTESFEGIVHLHGMFDPAYDKPVGGNLVLSSAEFGRAYLAEGWATDFIRAVIRGYLIVFVGYAADDPPVQYLLEALNRVADIPPRGLYAFQAGREEDAKALWTQKGVRAIAYAPDNSHAALWETLNAWSDRARDPERWRERLFSRARKGPQVLQPHERGQIAHLAGTEDGARGISQTKPVLPGSWLWVFDPATRYGEPGKAKPLKANFSDVDPFTDHSLDSDPPPPPANGSQPFQRREIPAGVVDVLAPNPLDQKTMGGRLRGREAFHMSELSPRLVSLSEWLRRICGEPAAVWWASGQSGLHPAVIRQIEFALDHEERVLPPLARSAWRYLFESWVAPPDADHNFFALKDAIARDGWTKPHIRRFAAMSRGRLKTSRPYWAGALPPGTVKRLQLRDLVHLEVRYPERHVRFEIPDEQLLSIIPLLRQNIEYAVDLHHEIGSRSFPLLAPIEPDPNLVGTSVERDYGINRSVLEFADLFRRLAQHDKAAALREVAAWRQHDDPVFGRLRIWATRLDNILDDAAAGEVLSNLDDAIFWGFRDQRDLLLSLRQRWQTMPTDTRAAIEKRLLAGPPPVKGLSAARNRQQRASATLDRVVWLCNQGCVFATNVESSLVRLRKAVPQWAPLQAARAADSREGRGDTVRTDTSFGDLENVPISELIPRAMQGQKRVWGESQEYDPFAGLCEKRPVRVLAGLRCELKKGADVASAWTQFLYSAARRTDKPKLAALIAGRLATLPQPVLDAIIMPASHWLESAHKQLYEHDPGAFHTVFDKLVSTVAASLASAEPKALAPGETRDWVNASYGSAAGHIAVALSGDPALAQVGPQDAMPNAWLVRAERLLALPGDHGRFSLVHFARRLGWLHNRAGAWSEQHIVAAMLGDGASSDAALAGFFTNPQVGDTQLYMLLKPLLIDLAMSKPQSPRRDPVALGRLFVGGWLTPNDAGTRWLPDAEFRRVLVYGGDDLRTDVLWHVEWFEDFAEKITFLRKVWPLQLAVRTAAVVGRLCNLAFDEETHFPELVGAILPLVSHADGGRLDFPLTLEKNNTIAKNYPDEVLGLLVAALPDDVTHWPYGVNQMLDRLTQAKPTLVTDPRMIRLKGIWDRR
jgi:hypothetical protein